MQTVRHLHFTLIIIIIIMIIFVIIVLVIAIAIIISSFSMLALFISLVFIILFYLCIYRIFLSFKCMTWSAIVQNCNKNTETVSVFSLGTLNNFCLIYSSDDVLLKWHYYILPLTIIYFIL